MKSFVAATGLDFEMRVNYNTAIFRRQASSIIYSADSSHETLDILNIRHRQANASYLVLFIRHDCTNRGANLSILQTCQGRQEHAPTTRCKRLTWILGIEGRNVSWGLSSVRP